MTQPPPSPAEIEAFLPPDNAYLDLHDLLKGYGKYWISQPSVSHYKRYYDVTEKGQLLLWEGYDGGYDPYGDFLDNDHFFNEVVKGVYLFLNFSAKVHIRNRSVEMWGTDGLRAHYESLSALRQAMITEWHNLKPKLNQSQIALREFIAQHREPVVNLLRDYGQSWLDKADADNAHFAVYAFITRVYLVLWNGAVGGVMSVPDDSQGAGYPKMYRDQIERYYEFRVSFKCVPVRFDLEQRRWNQNEFKPTDFGLSVTESLYPSLTTFEALQEVLQQVLPRLNFLDLRNGDEFLTS